MEDSSFLEALVLFPFLANYTEIVPVVDCDNWLQPYAGMYFDTIVNIKNSLCDTLITIDIFEKPSNIIHYRSHYRFRTIPQLMDFAGKVSYVRGTLAYSKENTLLRASDF